jgi:hypothetical protein
MKMSRLIHAGVALIVIPSGALAAERLTPQSHRLAGAARPRGEIG